MNNDTHGKRRIPPPPWAKERHRSAPHRAATFTAAMTAPRYPYLILGLT